MDTHDRRSVVVTGAEGVHEVVSVHSSSVEIDVPREQVRKQGRRLALANLIVANLVAAGILIAGGFNVETLLDGVLATLTKVGVPWFVLAMICAPLNELFHNSTTKWLYTNRRYIGLSFAAWHLMHWPILISVMVLMGPSEFWDSFAGMLPKAGSVLLVVTLMAATSTDGAVRFLGRPLWNAIHRIGLYTIWIWYLQVLLLPAPGPADVCLHLRRPAVRRRRVPLDHDGAALGATCAAAFPGIAPAIVGRAEQRDRTIDLGT